MLGNRKYGNSNTVESRLRPPKPALDVKAKCATTKDAKVRDVRPHVDKNSIKVGDRVAILGSKFGSRGNVRYLGKVEFAEGVWCGVELDCNEGKNDGMVGSKRYFSCRPNYGLFALLEKVRLLSADEDVCSQKAESAIVPSKKTVVGNTDKIRLVVGLTVEKSSSPRPAQSENIAGKKKLPTRQKDLAMRRQSDIFPINKKANDKVVSKIDIVVEKPNKQAALSQQNRRRTLDGDPLKMKLPSYKNTPRRQSTGCATTAQKLAAPAYYAIPEVDTKNDILSAMLDSNSVGSSENNNGKSSEANTLDSTFTINISPLPEPRVDAKTALRIAYDVDGSSTQRESDVGLNPDCKAPANQFTNQIKNARLCGDIGFTPGTFIASLDASSFGLLDEIYLEDNSLLQQNRNSGAVGKNKMGKKITAKKKITPPSAHSSKGTCDSHVQPANPVDGSLLLTDRDFGKEITCTSTPVRLKSVSDERRSIGKTPKRSSASEKMLMQSATPKSNLPKRISGKKIATEKVCLASGDGFGNKEFKSSANSIPIHGRTRDKVEDCVIKKKTSTKASTIRISPNSSNDKDEFVHEVDYEVFDNEDLNQRTSRDAGIQEFFDDQDGLMSRLDLDREGGANFCPGDFQNLVTSFSLDSLSRNPHLLAFPANEKLVVSQKSCSSPNVMGDQLLDNLAYLDSKVSEAIKESSRICSNLVKFHHQDLFNASSQFLADQIQNLSARGQQLRSFLSEITAGPLLSEKSSVPQERVKSSCSSSSSSPCGLDIKKYPNCRTTSDHFSNIEAMEDLEIRSTPGGFKVSEQLLSSNRSKLPSASTKRQLPVPVASSSTLFKHGAFGPNQTVNNRSCSEPPNHDIKQDDKPMDTGRKGLKKESDTNKSTGNTRFETVGHQEASDARGITTKPRSNVGQARNSLGYGRPAATTVHLKVGKGRQLPDADLVRAASSRNETTTADPKGTKLRPLSSSHTPRPNMNRSSEYHAPGRTPSTSISKSKAAFDAAPKVERTNSDIVNSNARTSFRSNTSSSSHPRRLSPISQHSVQNGQSSVSRLKITPQLNHLSSKLTPVRTESSGNHFTSRIATPAVKEDKLRTASSGSRLAPVSSANSFTRQRNPSGHDSSRIEAKHNLINQSQLASKSGQSKIAARQPHLTSLQCSTPARGGSRASSQVSLASDISSKSANNSLITTSSTVSKSTTHQNVDALVSDVVADLQLSNQPDLLPNSNKQTFKYDQLQSQYDAREKRLFAANVELAEKSLACEALAIIVQCFTKKIDDNAISFSQLRTFKKQLATAVSKNEVLVRQRDALISEIQSLKEESEVEINGLKVTHQVELHAVEDNLREVEAKYYSALSENEQLESEIRKQFESEVSTLQTEYAQKEQEMARRLADAEVKAKQKLSELQKIHDTKVKDLTSQFESIKSALMDKVDQLKVERDLLQRREEFRSDGEDESRLQSALSQSDVLQQEVESLKVVLSLRNQEIGKLRSQNGDLEKQLVSLTEAKNKIERLQHQLENAEALVNLKADYEKELAEKHTSLLRRYDKETKVNKRLSMDKEELTWKLNRAATESPNLYRRSNSSQPTKSAPGTPMLARRPVSLVLASHADESDSEMPGDFLELSSDRC